MCGESQRRHRGYLLSSWGDETLEVVAIVEGNEFLLELRWVDFYGAIATLRVTAKIPHFTSRYNHKNYNHDQVTRKHSSYTTTQLTTTHKNAFL